MEFLSTLETTGPTRAYQDSHNLPINPIITRITKPILAPSHIRDKRCHVVICNDRLKHTVHAYILPRIMHRFSNTAENAQIKI